MQEKLPPLYRVHTGRKRCLFASLVKDNEDGDAARFGTRLGAFGASAPHEQAVEGVLWCIGIAADVEYGLSAVAGIGCRKMWMVIEMVRLSVHA